MFGLSNACPIPIALVGHDTFVPALLLTTLVLSSVVVFLLSFGSVVLATFRARQACARHKVSLPDPSPLEFEAVVPNARRAKWLVVVGDDSLSAYCIGLVRPWVVVSSRLFARLGEPGLRAVLEHEASHRRRHDPLRAALASSLAQALFFVPSLGDLAQATLAENEISADASAVGQVGRANLVSALLVLLGHPAPAGSATMASAPLLELRLDALEHGSRPVVRLARSRLVISAVLVVALLATAAWLPGYPPSRMVRSVPAAAVRVQPL